VLLRIIWSREEPRHSRINGPHCHSLSVNRPALERLIYVPNSDVPKSSDLSLCNLRRDKQFCDDSRWTIIAQIWIISRLFSSNSPAHVVQTAIARSLSQTPAASHRRSYCTMSLVQLCSCAGVERLCYLATRASVVSHTLPSNPVANKIIARATIFIHALCASHSCLMEDSRARVPVCLRTPLWPSI